MKPEEWRPVVGYEGLYEVSTQGRVRSIDRSHTMTGRHKTPYTRRVKGKQLKLSLNSAGYPQAFLHMGEGGKWHLVHRLVAKAFLPNPSHLPEVNHINEIKDDNSLSNLEWCSRVDNCNHSIRNRADTKGGRAVLDKDQVVEAINLINEEGMTLKDVGDKFGVTPSCIHRICKGLSWSWLTGIRSKAP